MQQKQSLCVSFLNCINYQSVFSNQLFKWCFLFRTKCGQYVFACSLDGTIACCQFSLKEIGKSLPSEEKVCLLSQRLTVSIFKKAIFVCIIVGFKNLLFSLFYALYLFSQILKFRVFCLQYIHHKKTYGTSIKASKSLILSSLIENPDFLKVPKNNSNNNIGTKKTFSTPVKEKVAPSPGIKNTPGKNSLFMVKDIFLLYAL